VKKITNYFIDMITDNSGHINSKIVLGLISFIVSVVMGFISIDIQYVIAFLTFSASAIGFSCFDNNSAFRFQKTTTETSTSNKTTTIDIAESIKQIKKGRK